jgi:hypothetical protein
MKTTELVGRESIVTLVRKRQRMLRRHPTQGHANKGDAKSDCNMSGTNKSIASTSCTNKTGTGNIMSDANESGPTDDTAQSDTVQK